MKFRWRPGADDADQAISWLESLVPQRREAICVAHLRARRRFWPAAQGVHFIANIRVGDRAGGFCASPFTGKSYDMRHRWRLDLFTIEMARRSVRLCGITRQNIER